MNKRLKNIGIWALKLIAAFIMLQTLYFKFSGAPESVYIFKTIGLEPAGRIGTGILELVASILILIPAATVFGALLGVGLMSGAIFFHLTKLGLNVMDDGGQLFIYAVLVLLCSLALVFLNRTKIFDFIRLHHRYRF